MHNGITVTIRPQFIPELFIMHTNQILTATALAVALATGGFTAIPSLAQDHKSDARVEAKSRLSMAEVSQRIAALGYGPVERIERESNVYEVRTHTRGGERVKLHVDAASGEIVRVKSEAADDSTRAERRRGEARDDREACTKRRCRDDRAQTMSSEKVGWYLSDLYGRMTAAGL